MGAVCVLASCSGGESRERVDASEMQMDSSVEALADAALADAATADATVSPQEGCASNAPCTGSEECAAYDGYSAWVCECDQGKYVCGEPVENPPECGAEPFDPLACAGSPGMVFCVSNTAGGCQIEACSAVSIGTGGGGGCDLVCPQYQPKCGDFGCAPNGPNCSCAGNDGSDYSCSCFEYSPGEGLWMCDYP
jgi:hypothetical protein